MESDNVGMFQVRPDFDFILSVLGDMNLFDTELVLCIVVASQVTVSKHASPQMSHSHPLEVLLVAVTHDHQNFFTVRVDNSFLLDAPLQQLAILLVLLSENLPVVKDRQQNVPVTVHHLSYARRSSRLLFEGQELGFSKMKRVASFLNTFKMPAIGFLQGRGF